MYSYELGYIITPLKDFNHHIKFVTTDLFQRGFLCLYTTHAVGSVL